MTSQWCMHEGRTVLLVEGENDCHVVLALCSKFSLPEVFGIYQCGSDSQAIRRLNALILKSDRPDIIGLVVDADSPDLSGRWQSVRNKLAHYPYQLPNQPDPLGTVVEGVDDLPKLGFWLMPNNQDAGMLEDFCGEMVPPAEMAVVEQCVVHAEIHGCATFKAVHRSKALIHTYLALQDEPGRPLGQAITANSLRSNTATATAFSGWLLRLFTSPGTVVQPASTAV